MPEYEILPNLPGGTENPGEQNSLVLPEENDSETLSISRNIDDSLIPLTRSPESVEGGPELSTNVGEEAVNSRQFPSPPSPTEGDISQTITIPFRTTSDNWSALEIKPSELGRNLGQEEQTLIKQVADQLSLAMENAHLFQQTQQLASELQILYEMARDLSEKMDISYVAEAVYKHTTRLLDINYFSLGLYTQQNQNQSLYFPYVSLDGNKLETRDKTFTNGIIEYVIHNQKPLLISSDVKSNCNVLGINFDFQAVDAEIKCFICVPLILRNDIIGIIFVCNLKDKNSLNEHHLSLLVSIASQSAIAIENARSYELAQQAIEEMRELDMLKSQFLANMSHELRTPLNSIIGFSKVILKGIDGPITELQEQDLNAINSSGHHLLRLINDILDFSKIDANKMELAIEDVNLVELIETVISTIGGLIKDKPITLVKNISSDIPVIQVDPIRIRQVLINLLSNAAKFTDQGTITITANNDVSTTGEPLVKIQIIDTGSGISKESQEKLFQPFSQVDSSPSRKIGGTGLGLSISKKLIELHGGTIGVSSVPNEGSVFFFTLPIKTKPTE